MSDTPVLDRAKAPRPVPKPGILDIAPYVPGKAKVEGVEHPLKLSANENVLGSSPLAREAYAGAAAELHLYPDSRTTILRAAIAERFRLEPERLIFGCGSDEVFALLNQTFLEPGDNIVQGEYAFAAFAIGARACQATPRRSCSLQGTLKPKLATGRSAISRFCSFQATSPSSASGPIRRPAAAITPRAELESFSTG